MSTSRHFDKICVAVIAVVLVLTAVVIGFGVAGSDASGHDMGYESRLFDTSAVHTIDIVMEDWDSFIETCENEEYSACTAVIDGEKYSNIGIRAKGNTSLSSVKAMGSQRYSFKLEFDQYEEGRSYYGLDKLCLNNLIQDNTMMKDYIVYTLMNEFGADAPLCSFSFITVNGEDWGLYLAVEGVEDSFLERNYGSESGELYKPDSMSFGGGRGNGKDFSMDDLEFGDVFTENTPQGEQQTLPEQFTDNISQIGETAQDMQGILSGKEQMPQMPDGDFNPSQGGLMPGGDFNPSQGGLMPDGDFNPSQDGQMPQIPGNNIEVPNMGGATEMPSVSGGMSGMGSDDVKLKYIDDNPDSYANIFDNAKTDISSADKKRLIASLKKLSGYEDIENVVDTDEVMRYFVVHNFVCNGDSYTGSMIHNYYLRESDGVLSMIPWDYNLAFGTFQGNQASSVVNSSIDSPVSGGSTDDRPMLGWIFSDEAYTDQYHELFSDFIELYFSDGELEKLINDTAELIRHYVEKDPTKFCTSDEFEKGAEALASFVSLRAEAVSRQLEGDSSKVDTGSLNISDMGTMNSGAGGGFSSNTSGNMSFTGPWEDSQGMKLPVDGSIDNQSADGITGATPDTESSGIQLPEEFKQNDTPPVMPGSNGNEYNNSGGFNQDSGQSNENSSSIPQKPNNAIENKESYTSVSSDSAIILTAVSVAILVVGLIIVIKKK